MPLRLAATTGQEPHDGWIQHRGRFIPRPHAPISATFGARLLQRLVRAEATVSRTNRRPSRTTKRSAA
jgi:hypothetical protein